jgi:TrmH family RNA methyltransferase
MANTGLDELVIVEPAAPRDRTARAFAVGAGTILDEARLCSSFADAIAPYQQLVGTSSQRSRVAKVEVLTPRAMASQLAAAPRLQAALVFGPEPSGLTTEELAACSMLVSIPASRRQPTFNLAQAVLILSYELFVAGQTTASRSSDGERADMSEVEGLLDHARRLLTTVGFSRDDTFPSVFRDLRRLSTRAGLTSREVQILRGMLRRTEHRVAPGPSTASTDE